MAEMLDFDVPASDLAQCASPKEATARLEALYDEAHALTRARFDRYLAGEAMEEGSGAVYPYLCAVVPAESAPQTSKLALGQIAAVSARSRWRTRAQTPWGLRPPWRSRSSWALRVWLIDSMI